MKRNKSYAQEICGPQEGVGLEYTLAWRQGQGAYLVIIDLKLGFPDTHRPGFRVYPDSHKMQDGADTL